MGSETSQRRSNRRRFLILSCSARKHAVTGKVAAWDLYDGMAFRVVKRLEREGQFPDDVDILILSAQHGLIRPHHKISFYDLRMTKELASQQAARNRSILRAALCDNKHREVFVMAGKKYLAALVPITTWLPMGVTLTMAEGGIGRKLQRLKAWLLEKARC
jgi:cytoplasmic iron level regulating protein YaaA (DUF328/UPF0246 family)